MIFVGSSKNWAGQSLSAMSDFSLTAVVGDRKSLFVEKTRCFFRINLWWYFQGTAFLLTPALPIQTRIWSLSSLQHLVCKEEPQLYTVAQESAVMGPTHISWAPGKVLCASPRPWIWRLLSLASERADAVTWKCLMVRTTLSSWFSVRNQLGQFFNCFSYQQQPQQATLHVTHTRNPQHWALL